MEESITTLNSISLRKHLPSAQRSSFPLAFDASGSEGNIGLLALEEVQILFVSG
jgi:hypothetical protein